MFGNSWEKKSVVWTVRREKEGWSNNANTWKKLMFKKDSFIGKKLTLEIIIWKWSLSRFLGLRVPNIILGGPHPPSDQTLGGKVTLTYKQHENH